jgi:uncharacterized protein
MKKDVMEDGESARFSKSERQVKMAAGSGERKFSRRGFLKAAGASAVVAGAACMYGRLLEPLWVETTFPAISLPGLPRQWDGLRIAHLSDLHYPWRKNAAAVEHGVAATIAAKPDLILFTGDYWCGRDLRDAPLAAHLRRLSAPLGKFGILGNHDYEFGQGAETLAMLADAGVTLLDNRSCLLERGGRQLCLVGVGDL